jgi:hypothetical protein
MDISPLVCIASGYNGAEAVLDHLPGGEDREAAEIRPRRERIRKDEETKLGNYPASSSPPGLPVIYHRYWKLGIEEVREWEGLY